MHTVRTVSAETVRPLRTAVLRPGWEPGRLATYPEDETVAVHVAADLDGGVHGVGTVYAEAPPAPLAGAVPGGVADAVPEAAYAPGAGWRLRGMATSDAARGTGLGRAVLDGCFDAVRQRGGAFLWCNARLGAVGFYQRMGLATVGDEFDIAGIGPHYVMWRAV